jgi:hypothetical protein
MTLLQSLGVNDRELLRGVKEDVEKKRYHIACNRVFETTHKNEIKKVRTQIEMEILFIKANYLPRLGQGSIIVASKRA